MRLGIVTGLAREACCLPGGAGAQAQVRCLGMGARAAATAADELLREGCDALLSFGLCGGLGVELRAGQLVLPDRILGACGGRWPVDAGWRQRLMRRLASCAPVQGGLLGSDRPLLGIADKRECGERFCAIAVDMESHAVARAAAAAGTPFLAVRVVVDAADCAVPAWVARIVDDHGRPRLGALLAALAANAADLPVLLRLARDQRRARARLRRVALDAGPLFALA